MYEYVSMSDAIKQIDVKIEQVIHMIEWFTKR